jgi:hypothetical protein
MRHIQNPGGTLCFAQRCNMAAVILCYTMPQIGRTRISKAEYGSR